MRQGRWAILCSVLVACFLTGGGAVFAAEPIAIGSIASLTGYLSDQAQNVVEGTELGIEEMNAKGGVLGRQLKLYARDDEMKPPVGARRFEDLVKNDKIAMHTGVVFAPVSTAIQQANRQLEEKGVVLFQAATNKLEQDPKNMQPYLFFIGSSLEAYGLAGGEHAARNMGKKAFILYADYAGWGWVIRDAFVQSVTANGGEIVGSLAVPPGTTDYGPFLTQVLAKKPDYVACIVNGMMFINCMKQAYAMGMKDKMKFMSFHGNIEEVNGCGPEVIQDVILVTDYFWNLPNEKNKAFVEKYLKKYGSNKRPSMRHFLHYASVLLWADGVKKAGSVNPKAVSSALLGFKADYGKGEIEIRKTGDHTTVQPIVVARGKGPKEMKDKFDTQEIVKVYTGDKYFYSAKEKGY